MTTPGTRSSAWAQALAIAARDLKVQLTYKFEFLLQQQGVAVAVAVSLFLSRLVPRARLHPYTSGYFDFALIGLAATLLSGVGLTKLSASFSGAQREGTLETLLMSPVRLSTVLGGTLVLPLGLASLEAVACLALGAAFGAHLEWSGLAVAVPIFGLLVASLAAIGILSVAAIVLTKRGDPVSALLGQATSFLGGALFPVSLLPEWVRWLSHLIPTYYALNALRAALLPGGRTGDIVPNAAALAAITAVLLPFSVWCLSHALRAARVTGTLGTY